MPGSLQISSRANELLSKAESENYFTSTFFVRWAYRLYNGLYMASPPVMMPLNAGYALGMSVESQGGIGETSLTKFSVNFHGNTARLEYEIPGYENMIDNLADWNDVITGVELYVTRGISNYNQDGIDNKV